MGTVLSAETRHSGAIRRTKKAVRSPKIGATITLAAISVITASARPASKPSAIPVCWCSRSIVLRWTRALLKPAGDHQVGHFLGDQGDRIAAEFRRHDQARQDHDRAQLEDLDRGTGDRRPADAVRGGVAQLIGGLLVGRRLLLGRDDRRLRSARALPRAWSPRPSRAPRTSRSHREADETRVRLIETSLSASGRR